MKKTKKFWAVLAAAGLLAVSFAGCGSNASANAGSSSGSAASSSAEGSFDMYEIMKALYDIGFDGPIRPDHGRMIWGEKAMPGYGLYDRALGATYLNGLWEAIDKSHKRGI